ncbi:Ulp1 peptidase protein [Dioscorea alata]|uniref:Ulp1 peptidase protein n=1 Tax=Dioscorea alata TaxID=55571 RepID=A0ACB7V4T5_DIOAL|nr:Ulp1 peptidase protein [Dioscorea alata]
MPIILHDHFHIVVLDNIAQEYRHYSSCQSEEYDEDAAEMRKLFDNCIEMELGEAATSSYALIHDRSTPRQKRGSLDCSVYVMRFIEQLLADEKLRVPQTDVPYLRLKYAARILLDGRAAGVGDKGETSSRVNPV